METLKKIKIKVVSMNGHDEFLLVPDEAVKFIKDKCAEEGKWAYVDGDFVNTDTLTSADLEDAEEVMLANMLAGGEDTYKTMVQIVDQRDDIVIKTDSDTISVICNKNRITTIIKNIASITDILGNWLTNEARNEVLQVSLQVGTTPPVYNDINLDLLKLTYSVPIDSTDKEISLKLNYDVEKEQLNIGYNPNAKYPTLYAREFICHLLETKLIEFADNNVKKIREAVNY